MSSSGKEKNLALIFKQVPHGVPIPGKDLAVEDIGFDRDAPLPENSISVEILYLSLDPYQRNRMRAANTKSYSSMFVPGNPIDNTGLAKVIKSNSTDFKEGDLIKSWVPFAQFTVMELSGLPANRRPTKIDTTAGLDDIRHWLGALGMPGLTAYSSLYDIGQPKKGETIFVSSAAGAVGQLVGAIAKREGLRVIGSVGSDEKLKYIIEESGFDDGFNYKKEKPTEALARLAPDGIDIYFDNVGGDHLEAAIGAMKTFGRIVACGMISLYNTPPEQWTGPKNIIQVVGKSLTIRGFIVNNENMGPKYTDEHQRNVLAWLTDGSLKAKVHEWSGIEKGAEAFIGMLAGENFGKAVLKTRA